MAFVVAMIERDDDVIFYAQAEINEHGGVPEHGKVTSATSPSGVIIPGVIKRNRFVGIDSGRGKSMLMTQYLRFKSPELKLNANVPYGSIRVQLNDGAPVTGFTFDDFDPIIGDSLDFKLSWRGKNLQEFVNSGKWVRVQIELNQGTFFSLEGEFDFTINTRAYMFDRL